VISSGCDELTPVLNHCIHRPLIIGHYGGCNTGDEAMLAALLRAMGPDLQRRASFVSKNGHGHNLGLVFGAKEISVGLLPVIKTLLKSDALVLGGGTHFHDDYTTCRYLRHFRYMLRITCLSIIAKLMGRQVVWLGMGFGPFYRRPTRWVTRLGLKFCDRVSVRDATSLREISGWIKAQNLVVAFDLAALLADGSTNLTAPTRAKNRRCRILGISVTSVRQSMTGGPRVEAAFWRRLASALSKTLEDRPGLTVKVVVLRGGNREADTTLSHDLYQAIENAHPGRSELIPYSRDPREILGSIAACDAFVATRYHAGLLAYLAGCNLLFFAYHRKVCDLAREIGLSESACMKPSEKLPEEVLYEKLNQLIDGQDPYQAQLPVGDAIRRAWLNIQALGGATEEK